MSKSKRRDQGAEKNQGQLGGQRPQIRLVAVVLSVVVLAAGIFFLLDGKQIGAQSTMAPAAKGSATGLGAKTEFASLQGRWLRPDGGYVLEIKDIDTSGKMTAAYFNPRTINVSRAEGSREGAATKVFIELRDVNYPGATYNLTYDREKDQLRGVYFQPALQQSFDVFFLRMK